MGNATGNNDTIVFNDTNNNGVVDAGDAAVVLTNVAAAGAAVDLNGSAADNGYPVATAAPAGQAVSCTRCAGHRRSRKLCSIPT